MTDEQFAQLLAAVNRLADSAEEVAANLSTDDGTSIAELFSQAFFPPDTLFTENFGSAMEALTRYLRVRFDG